MIKVERFVNQLMASNCYIVVDEDSRHCLCIDPASEKSEHEIDYIHNKSLSLDYIFLTHEHTDHTWGVNALLEAFPNSMVVCSELCKEALPHEAQSYFQLYYDNTNYEYNINRVDYTVETLGWKMVWMSHDVVFIPTPGHSPGSICIAIENSIFGGDTLLPFKPVIMKRNGGSKIQFIESVSKILSTFPENAIVYSGHGDGFMLKNYHLYIK